MENLMTISMKSVPEFIAIGKMPEAIQTGSVKDRRTKKFFSHKCHKNA